MILKGIVLAIKNNYTLGFALILVACLAIPAFQRIQKIHKRIIVASNLKKVGEARMVYSNDYQTEENTVAASLDLLMKEAGIEPNSIDNIEE